MLWEKKIQCFHSGRDGGGEGGGTREKVSKEHLSPE